VVLAAYVILFVKAGGGAGQGFVNVLLQVLAFIVKKVLLAYTDHLNIEVAMIVSGVRGRPEPCPPPPAQVRSPASPRAHPAHAQA